MMHKAKIMTPEGITHLKTSYAWYENTVTLLAVKQWEDALAYMVSEHPAEKLMGWVLKRIQASPAAQSDVMQQCAQEIALWLKDHDDARRWRIFQQAEMLGFDTPLGALGLSLFWLQGSMTPAELEPVYPEKHLSPLMLHCALKLLCVSQAADDAPLIGAQKLVSEWNVVQGGH